MKDIADIIKAEVNDYSNKTVEIADGIEYSEYKLKRRIANFKNRHYPTGKITDTGEYEHWFDIIQPRVNSAVKNIRIDTKHVTLFSRSPIKDFPAVYVGKLAMNEWMWETGRAEELKDAVEMFCADGNVLLRRCKDGYELWDPDNTFITNPLAKTIEQTAIIERFYLTQSELREGGYDNVDDVIKHCGNKYYKRTEKSKEEESSTPLYELFRRTGEISEKMLRKAQGRSGGREDKYVYARVIVAGIGAGSGKERVLFAEQFPDGQTMRDYYREAHFGAYKGRWWREGMYELLMDHQVRANDIGNQLARGLEWAAKVLFRHTDVRTLQNVRTALDNGALIKSADLQQVEVRMQGFDQLVADWNRLNEDADKIANSFEVVQGGQVPSGTPFQLGDLMDTNATKYYAFLRQKLAIAYSGAFKDFVLPTFVRDMKGKDIIRVTGDTEMLREFRRLIADHWYQKNLARIGPHTPEIAMELKTAKMAELEREDPAIQNVKKIWEGVLPRLNVTIAGENYSIDEQRTAIQMLPYEQDPGRRDYIMDYIYAARGIPVPPKTQQQQPQNTPNQAPEIETEVPETV